MSFAFSSCARSGDKVDRTFENGIEVVHNRLVPHRVAGEPAERVLDEEFRIDTESADLAAAGLSDIGSFDVDSRGYIHAVQSPRRAEFLLLQFDDRGGLRKVFGRKGQGPGELQWPTLFNVNSRDEFMVWDGLARRFYIYDRDGDLIKESSGDNFQAGGLPLDNGTFYEILVFDFEGRLIRKIRKEFARVPVTSAEKSALLAKLAARRYPSAEKIDFPAHKPPFQYFFADEKGRLFVVTTERDEETGQNIYDIFNREGVLIGRRPIGWFDILRQYWELLRLDIAANHGRLYVLREKDSGFEELIVFRAAWR